MFQSIFPIKYILQETFHSSIILNQSLINQLLLSSFYMKKKNISALDSTHVKKKCGSWTLSLTWFHDQLDGESTTCGRNISLRRMHDQWLYESESMFEITTIVLTQINQIFELSWCTCITTLKLIRMYVYSNKYIFTSIKTSMIDHWPKISWPQNIMLPYCLTDCILCQVWSW